MEKINLEFLLLCDHSIKDERGKISIIGVFDNFKAEKLPAGIPLFYVVGRINIKEESIKNINAELFLKSKDKKYSKSLSKVTSDYIPKSIDGIIKINLVFPINRLIFEKTGEYIFELVINGKKVGETKLDIRIVN